MEWLLLSKNQSSKDKQMKKESSWGSLITLPPPKFHLQRKLCLKRVLLLQSQWQNVSVLQKRLTSELSFPDTRMSLSSLSRRSTFSMADCSSIRRFWTVCSREYFSDRSWSRSRCSFSLMCFSSLTSSCAMPSSLSNLQEQMCKCVRMLGVNKV